MNLRRFSVLGFQRVFFVSKLLDCWGHLIVEGVRRCAIAKAILSNSPKMMIILGLRSRDGMERILVDSNATIRQMKEAIAIQTHIPKDKQYLSMNCKILLSRGCNILYIDMMH